MKAVYCYCVECCKTYSPSHIVTGTPCEGHRLIAVYRAKNDINGNPRYVVSWLGLGLPAYVATRLTRKAGLSLYRGKDFGGGFVFSSYNVASDMEFILRTLKGL